MVQSSHADFERLAMPLFDSIYRFARWLAQDERTWLAQIIEEEQSALRETSAHNPWRALVDWRVLALSLAYFGTSAGLYTIGFWAPLIIRGFGFSVLQRLSITLPISVSRPEIG